MPKTQHNNPMIWYNEVEPLKLQKTRGSEAQEKVKANKLSMLDKFVGRHNYPETNNSNLQKELQILYLQGLT